MEPLLPSAQLSVLAQNLPHTDHLPAGQTGESNVTIPVMREATEGLVVELVNQERLHPESRESDGLGQAAHEHVLERNVGHVSGGHQQVRDHGIVQQITRATSKGGIGTEGVLILRNGPLAGSDDRWVVHDLPQQGVAEDILVGVQQGQEARYVHKGVLVGLEDKAGLRTVLADPIQPRQGLEGEVPVGVLEVHHHEVLEILCFLLDPLQLGVCPGLAQEEEESDLGRDDGGRPGACDGSLTPRDSYRVSAGGLAWKGGNQSNNVGVVGAGGGSVGRGLNDDDAGNGDALLLLFHAQPEVVSVHPVKEEGILDICHVVHVTWYEPARGQKEEEHGEEDEDEEAQAANVAPAPSVDGVVAAPNQGVLSCHVTEQQN